MTNLKRILILDDDSMHNMYCLILIRRYLREMNIEIIGFTDPHEGLQYIETEYDKRPVETILLVDLYMPGLTGWDVLNRLEGMPSAVLNYLSIYILTSSANPKEIARAQDYPFVKNYFIKPLANHIESLLQTTMILES